MERSGWGDLSRRPLLFPAAAFAAGAVISSKTAFSSGKFLLGAAALCAALALAGRHRVGAHLLLLLAAGFAGISLGTWQARVIVPEAVRSGASVLLEGEVEEVVQFEDSVRVRLAVSRAGGQQARFRALLYSERLKRRLFPGQRVLLPAALKEEPPPSNPGEMDLQTPRARRGLMYRGGFKPERLIVLSEPSPLRVWLAGVHAALAEATRQVAPSEEAAALFLTLAAGQRSELSPEAEEVFARSGLAHVLSVSGLHVAALALWLMWLVRRLAVLCLGRFRRFEPRRPTALLALPLVWAYVGFTGWQPPAIRSAVMASAFLIGIALRQRADALNSLSLAALTIVAFDPASAGELSMQLSFTAVFSLIVLSPALREAIPIPRPEPTSTQRVRFALERARETVLQTLCASVAVSLASLPLTAAAFHAASPAGVLSNVVALPLCALLTPIAAGAAAISALHVPAAWPLLVAGTWASELLLKIGEIFARLPYAQVAVPSFATTASVLFMVGLFAFALGRGRTRWLAMGVPLGLGIALWPLLPRSGLEVTFLAVGHGDAIVISSNGEHLLIDGGGAPRGADTAQKFLLPFLRERGIRSLKLAVLTHPHADHGLGLASLLPRFPTERLWLPSGSEADPFAQRLALAAGAAEVTWVAVGQPAIQVGEAIVEVLGPPADHSLLEGTNDRSVVLAVTHGQNRFLFTGDIEAAAEELIRPGEVTVLKAAHHGSRTSSTQDFLEHVRPRYVVYSVGRDSKFGFPHPEVVERALSVGARALRTDVHGAVRFDSDGHTVRLSTWRAIEPIGRGALPPPPAVTILSGP